MTRTTSLLALGLAFAAFVAAPAASRPKRLPDLIVLPSGLLDQQITDDGTRRLLRFTTVIVNAGSDRLEVTGRRAKDGRMRAFQVHRGKAPREIGEFEYHAEHGHWHLLNVAQYRLRDGSGAVVGTSDKISFCLRDDFHAMPNLPHSPPARRYFDVCNKDPNARRLLNGISIGWGDVYGRHLDDQWVEITGLPAGDYTLEVEVNPEGIVREASGENNVTTVPVTLP